VIGALQRLVDALASRLGRAVLLEDRRQRVIAYSQHDQPMDTVRRESILQRQTTPEVIAYLRRFGIAESCDPIRIAGNADFDLLPRVCIPLRHQDLLLGFIWFIDADESMQDEEVELALQMGSDFALALYRENFVEELAQRRESEAVRNLLVSDPGARLHAACELVDAGSFLPDIAVTALVVLPVGNGHPSEDAELRGLAIEQSLVQARRRTLPRHALHLLRFDHGLLLAAASDRKDTPVASLGRGLVRAMERSLGGLPGHDQVVVGVGEPQPGLQDVWRSYEQARQAAHVAASLPSVGPVTEWRELGVYRALAQLSADQIGSSVLHPGLSILLEDPDQTLARTLETYLDLAGNAQATAKALRLHRATLYYRLQRIEELARADLKDGNDRLTLHLGLKLARLNDRFQSAAKGRGRDPHPPPPAG
jgi:DNA-binding PucR family transcriptional regulator